MINGRLSRAFCNEQKDWCGAEPAMREPEEITQCASCPALTSGELFGVVLLNKVASGAPLSVRIFHKGDGFRTVSLSLKRSLIFDDDIIAVQRAR